MLGKIWDWFLSWAVSSPEYMAGVDAAGAGATEDDCPYHVGSQEARDWLLGLKNGLWKPLG